MKYVTAMALGAAFAPRILREQRDGRQGGRPAGFARFGRQCQGFAYKCRFRGHQRHLRKLGADKDP